MERSLMPTKMEERAAAEVLAMPEDLESIRERRYVVKDILNTALLSPEARTAYEQLYAKTGRALEKAVKAS